MDDFAKEVITKMETYEKKEKRQFIVRWVACLATLAIAFRRRVEVARCDNLFCFYVRFVSILLHRIPASAGVNRKERNHEYADDVCAGRRGSGDARLGRLCEQTQH